MRRGDLERLLEAVPRHPSPDPALEQYRTPPAIAAALLLAAHAEGAIAGRRVLDLGCGTGVFTAGAVRLGAGSVTGVDVDAASLALARDAIRAVGGAVPVEFVRADVATWDVQEGGFDTAIMNPPFGAQKDNRHADRLFLRRAAQAVAPAGTVWFLAQTRTEGFLAQEAVRLKGRLDRVGAWDYPLEATMAHHRAEARVIHVGGYRLAWT